MAEFEPEEFFETDVTRTRLAKLDKSRLWKLMEYLELDALEEAKKPELMQSILVNCNPEEKERMCARQEREREREHEKLNLIWRREREGERKGA